MIQLEELKLVRAISHTGSVHRAARELGMSQPALSKKITRMEDKLGVAVFHRTNRGTTLTLYGDRLLTEGKVLLDKAAQLCRDIEMMAGLELAELRIGVGPIIEYFFLPETMSRLLSKYPHVNFEVKVDNVANLTVALQERTIDVAVGYFYDGPEDQICDHPLASEELVFVVRKEHPACMDHEAGKSVSLFDYPMAIPDLPPKLATWFDRMVAQSGHKPAKLQCDNYHIIKRVLHRSDHFTGAPRSMFHKELAQGLLRIFPVELDRMQWASSVRFTEEAQHSPIVMAFLAEIAEVAKLSPKDLP